ncbi:MAG: hypothetical protein KAS32_00875 [Candidatus Peribacteraceae bacterium]|nr:hypothetical protein [Candidatus Peribacteraceae bacterium]
MEQTKDLMITFRSTTKKKNQKGGDWLQLYMNADQVAALANTLATKVHNERGVRLDFHTSQKKNTTNGNVFDSTICFVKEVQPRQDTFKAPEVAVTEETASRIEKLKQEIA